MGTAIAAHAATEDWKQEFAKVSDVYFDLVYFRYNPANATVTGVHAYDGQLEDYSRKTIDAEIAALKSFEKRIEAIHPDEAKENFVPRSDREMVLWNIRSELLTDGAEIRIAG